MIAMPKATDLVDDDVLEDGSQDPGQLSVQAYHSVSTATAPHGLLVLHDDGLRDEFLGRSVVPDDRVRVLEIG